MRGTPTEGNVSFELEKGAWLGVIPMPAKLTAHIEQDLEAIAFEAELPDISVRGSTTSSDLPTFLSRPTVFSNVLIPRAFERVFLDELEPGALRFVVNADPWVRFLDGAETASALVPCADVTFTPDAFGSFGSVLGASIDQGTIRGPKIKLSETADGPPTVEIQADSEDFQVWVLEREGKRMRIVWPNWWWLVVGWVDARRFKPEVNEHEADLEEVQDHAPPDPPARILVCPHPLAVHGHANDREGVFAVVHPGKAVGITSESEATYEVDLEALGVIKAETAAFTVSKRDTVGCRTMKP